VDILLNELKAGFPDLAQTMRRLVRLSIAMLLSDGDKRTP
jgi:hypothetical protein